MIFFILVFDYDLMGYCWSPCGDHSLSKMASSQANGTANTSTTESAKPAARSTPKDALVMSSILREMGISDYEPRVVNQMLEFTYRK